MIDGGHNRPSQKETFQKVKTGLEALEKGRRVAPLTKHLAEAYDFLGVSTAAELWVELAELLKELLSTGPSAHYSGSRPPQRSYEDPPLSGKELWAYSWSSDKLGKQVYLKFALGAPPNTNKSEASGIFYFVDCHESRPPQRN